MTAVRESLVLVVIAAILLPVPLTQTVVDDSDVQVSVTMILQSEPSRDVAIHLLRQEAQSNFEAPGLRNVPISCCANWDSQRIFASSTPDPTSRRPLRC